MEEFFTIALICLVTVVTAFFFFPVLFFFVLSIRFIGELKIIIAR